RTNYIQTALSLSSTLNMQLLQDLVPTLDRAARDRGFLGRLIARSEVRRFLAERGYRFVSVSTGYALTEIRDADTYVAPWWVPDQFAATLLQHTPLTFVSTMAKVSGGWGHGLHRERIEYALRHVPETIAG